MCLTCQILNQQWSPPGGIIYQDDFVLLHQSLDINVPGYFILSPVRHVNSYSYLSDEEEIIISKILKKAVSFLEGLPEVENVHTDGKLDGAKLFSQVRIDMKSTLVEENKQIIDLVEQIRQYFNE
jgi:diadenosine tetraphosphate (Ap4A) HIT family hydrolase